MLLSPKGGDSRGPSCSGWSQDLFAPAWGMRLGCTRVGHDLLAGSKAGAWDLQHPWSLAAP